MKGIYDTRTVQNKMGERLRAARGKTKRPALVRLLTESPKAPVESKAGMTAERLKQWEYGNNPISHEWIPAICEVLDCDIGYLFGEYDERKRELSDVSKTTGLSENAVRQLYLLYHHPQCKTPETGGLGVAAKGYSIGHVDILSEIIESKGMMDFFNSIGFYLIFGGVLPKDAYTSNEEELTLAEHERFYKWANGRGLEIQPRKDICEMHLQKACDELKSILRDILERAIESNG